MELAAILLVTCLLVLSPPSASTKSGQLVLRHAYPENTNFSYIELACLYEDAESHILAVRAAFQLNGTDLDKEEELNVTDIGNGTIRFILTQEREGFFTCSLNESLSNNSIGLAAQPSSDYSGQSRLHEVELPDADSVVPTELQCDIQPGALRQRYSVQWRQILNDSYVFIADERMFNLTLNVNSSQNRSKYQCGVTIDHDGSNIRSYEGVLITIVTRSGVTMPPPETTIPSSIIIAVVVIGVVLPIACCSIIVLRIKQRILCRKQLNKFTRFQHSSLDDVANPLYNEQNCGHLTEESVFTNSSDTARLLDNLASLTENVTLQTNTSDPDSGFNMMPQSEEQVNVKPLQTSALEIPPWLDPTATLRDCTSDGRSYYDEHNDFRLEIPEGAIPEEERVTIDIGVALYGPFQYPEDLRPVSPVFRVCVRDQTSFRFLKPVTITIPHCLNLENTEDVESLGMTFLKGDHEMTSQKVYQFQRAEGQAIIEPRKRNGVLQITHFCYLCITSKKSKKSIRKAMFCISAAIPHTMSPSEPAYVYFFVTFLLKNCLETVRKQISRIPELREHKKKSQDFQFSKDTADPALEIVLPTSPPAGWTVGLQFSKQILVSEIDFFVSGENIIKELLKLKEEEGMYPPRFCVVISCSPIARQSQARIEFSGATKELLFDIPLNPLYATTYVASAGVPTTDEIPTLSLRNFVNHVGVNIVNRWQEFGILLDIPLSDLDTYPTYSCAVCLSRVFDTWQRKGSPEFSWETVVNVLESPLLNEMQLAKKVREMVTLHPKQDPSMS